MADNGLLAAVIVTFNRLDKLQLTLERTFANRFHRVVVVDNCSTDGTRDWLDSQSQPNLIVLQNDRNLGGAGGFHRGFQYVSEQLPEVDWLVCFDDDAYPGEGVVELFDQLDIPQDVGSLAAAVYLPDGRISEMNRPSKNPFWHLREFLHTAFKGRHGFHISDADYQRNSPVEVDVSSFVGCFVRLSLIRGGEIGLPRGELFIYADDIIYMLEARKAGNRHLFVPTIAFIHDCETLVNQKAVYQPLWKAYYTFRNGLELYRIASGLFYPLVILVKVPKWLVSVRHYKPGERLRYLKLTLAAVWHGVWRNYSTSHQDVVELSKGP